MLGSGCSTCPIKDCDAQYRGSRCAAQRARLGLEDPMTNADKIHSMSEQELVRLLVHTVADGCPPEMDWECAKDFHGWEGCEKCWTKWLQQPVKEGTP